MRTFKPRRRTPIAPIPCRLEVNDEAHTVQHARSIEYAKALAPQLLQRLGTRAEGCTVTVTTFAGEHIGVYTRKGWLTPTGRFPSEPEIQRWGPEGSSGDVR